MRAAIGNRRPAIVARVRALIPSGDLRHGVTLSAAMLLASALDYAVNVLTGRWLVPVEYGIFVSVSAILQVLTYLALATRNVAAFYTAGLSSDRDSADQVAVFVRRAWRWAWQWGLTATALMLLAGPMLAHLLRLPTPWPLWAAAPAVLLFFVRAITDGSLQGMQEFAGFGALQIAQALLRLVFAASLIYVGLRATGAILALPLAMAFVLPLAWYLLRPQLQCASQAAARPVSWHYSSYTLLGLAAYGVLVNMDALFVKHSFTPSAAGDYAPVVMLARISLFIPLAMGILLLPKVKERQSRGENARPVLLLALGASLAPSLSLTCLYFLFPGPLVKIVFTGAYANPGIVLGLASLAASLYAGVNIWLNYALALERPAFIYVLLGVLLLQLSGAFLFAAGSLVRLTLVMVSAGALGNVAGFLATWNVAPASTAVRAEVVGA